MTATPDPVEILERLSALHGAGLEVPDDLARAALAWLAEAAPAILDGDDAAQALGLGGRRGEAGIGTRRRRAARDQLLRELWNATDPTLPQLRRGAEVQTEARRRRPPWPVPADVRSVIRICTRNARFPVMDGGGVPPHGGTITATSNRP